MTENTEQIQCSDSVSNIAGIGPSTFQKLERHGFGDYKSCAYSTPETIREESGVGEETAKKVYLKSCEELGLGEPINGLERFENEQKRRTITFGVKSLDDLLGGSGIRSQELTCCAGKFSSSKTQIGFQLLVNSMLPVEEGGLGEDNKVVFFDQEHTFSGSRITQLAKAKGLDPKKVLKNTTYYRLDNSLLQIRALQRFQQRNETSEYGLIIVDSLMYHFRNDYSGRSRLANRQQIINDYLHKLQLLSIKDNSCVYLTNQIQTNPGLLYGDPDKMIGGNIVGHMLNPNIWLRKLKGSTRKARIKDSSDLPDDEAVYQVTDKGLEELE